MALAAGCRSAGRTDRRLGPAAQDTALESKLDTAPARGMSGGTTKRGALAGGGAAGAAGSPIHSMPKVETGGTAATLATRGRN